MHFPESKGKIRSKTAHYLIISSMWTLINSGPPPPFYKSELLSMLNLYKGVISAIYTHVLMQQKNQTVFTLKLKCTCILTNTHMLCSYTCIWIQWIKKKLTNIFILTTFWLSIVWFFPYNWYLLCTCKLIRMKYSNK